MSVTKKNFEHIMDEMKLKYFHRHLDNEDLWYLQFDGFNLIFILQEHGEFLKIITSELVNLNRISEEKRQAVYVQLMAWNATRKLGHYSADGQVNYSVAFPIEDGELTEMQLHRCLATVCYEAHNSFGELRRLAGVESSADRSFSDLVGRLLQRGASGSAEMN